MNPHAVPGDMRSKPSASSPETEYGLSVPADHRRKFGQVFTPPKLASLMADWVTEKTPSSLLDPAYGTGALVAACHALQSDLPTVAYELDPVVLNYAPAASTNVEIRNADFISSSISERFDAAIMNPPYIRHREIVGYKDDLPRISALSGASIPKSANLYIYFAVKALEVLNQGGRAAILIPAEWMSANFSKTFKSYLFEKELLKGIVTFSNCSNIFDDATTTASIILCEK